MSDIYENVRRVLDAAQAAAIRAGRDPEEILVLAASKMNSAERIREAHDAGIRAFGENRVQELCEKLPQNAYEGAQLHFIGHLQKNKVRQVTGVCELIHSVDSAELMEKISRQAEAAGIRQNVLLEVNIGGEASKSGIAPEALDDLAAMAGGFPGIHVAGLMTIPPAELIPGDNFKFFDRMYHLFVDINGKKYDNVTMTILSMGMSGDFETAIAAGSTLVRVGTAIFGPRNYAL